MARYFDIQLVKDTTCATPHLAGRDNVKCFLLVALRNDDAFKKEQERAKQKRAKQKKGKRKRRVEP